MITLRSGLLPLGTNFRQLLSNTGAILVHISKQTWLDWLGKARWYCCPPVLLVLASWLESSVSLVGPTRGLMAAGQGRGFAGV